MKGNFAMDDILVRAVSRDGAVKACAVSAREMAERARNIHGLSPVASAALGRALTAASMMGSALKGEGSSLTLSIKGGGPIGTVLAVSDSMGNVRGYVQNPGLELPLRSDGKLDVGGAVGCDGSLTIIKDLNMREPYIGSVQLVGGEIGEDVAAYFAESEQIPTACALGVLVDRDRSIRAAGGYLIQLLPGAAEDVVARVEKGVEAAGAVTAILDGNDDPEAMLRRVMPDFELDVLETSPVGYKCDCSRERVERALISLGQSEIESLISEQGGAEITCQFCDSVYKFTAEELRELIFQAKNKFMA